MPPLHRLLGNKVSLLGQSGSARVAFHTPPVKRTASSEHSPILLHHPFEFGPNGTCTKSTAPTEETTISVDRGNRLPLGVPRSTR